MPLSEQAFRQKSALQIIDVLISQPKGALSQMNEQDLSECFFACLISSPEPKAHCLANSIPVTPASVHRPSTFSNIFSFETTRLIELIFHMETP